MEFKVKELGQFRSSVDIQLNWDEVEPDYTRLLREYAKRGIPGFRPNKITPHAVEVRYGKKLKEKLITNVSNRYLHEIIGRQNLYPCGVSDPRLLEYNKGEIIRFDVLVEQPMNFDLPDYMNLEITEEYSDLESFKDALSGALCNAVNIDIPQSMIDMEEKMSYESGEKETQEDIIDRIKVLLVLHKIADKENLKPSEEEFNDRLKEMAEEYNLTAEQLKNFLVTTNGFHRVKLFQIGEVTLDYLGDKLYKGDK